MAVPSLIVLKPDAARSDARAGWRMVARGRMLLMALVAGLFPLTYALTVILVTGLALWHAHVCVQDIHYDSQFGRRDVELILTVLAEGLASFLLLRQLITPAVKKNAWQIVLPGDQPEFFQTVRLVADKVGAPMPDRVVVDSSAELQVEFTSLLGAILNRHLCLRVGMALPVGLQSAHFAAVLAHELGVFGRGCGVSSATFIRGVNHWFILRIRHDPWLDWLKERIKNRKLPWLRRMLCHLAYGAIWLSLRPLRVLHSVCRLVTREAMHHMVYRADQCAVRLAGAETCAEALLRRSRVVMRWHEIHDRLHYQSATDRLPDSIPMLVARDLPDDLNHDADLPPGLCCHWMDMAPSNEDRLRRMAAQGGDGIIAARDESTNLFRNFHQLARQVTYFHYQNDWGINVTEHRLVAIEETVHEHRASLEVVGVLSHYFRGLAHPERAFCGIAEENMAPRDSELLRLELQDCREWLNIYGERMATALEEWTKTWQLVRDLEMAHVLSCAGLPVHKPQFDLPSWTPQSFRDEIEHQRGIMDNLEGILRQYEGRMETRLASALELLWRAQSHELPAKLSAIRETLPNWVLVYEALGLHLPVLRELMTHFHAFQALGATVAGMVDSDAYMTTVQAEIPRLVGLVDAILTPLQEWPFPFRAEDDTGTPLSLAAFVAPQALEAGALSFDVGAGRPREAAQRIARQLNQVVIPLLDRYLNLYHQAFAWVTKAADMAEWHFLDPFDEEQVAYLARTIPQQRPQMHVPDPSLTQRYEDPELAYA